MDARQYGGGLSRVAPGQFGADQRQRLEAFTAAVGLLGKDALVDDLLAVAAYIAAGTVPDA